VAPPACQLYGPSPSLHAARLLCVKIILCYSLVSYIHVSSMQAQQQESNFTNSFLELFYDKYIAQLIALLSDSCEPRKAAAAADGPRAAPSSLALIADLLCFCVQQHSYRIKCASPPLWPCAVPSCCSTATGSSARPRPFLSLSSCSRTAIDRSAWPGPLSGRCALPRAAVMLQSRVPFWRGFQASATVSRPRACA
jgi:hypothetical protein